MESPAQSKDVIRLHVEGAHADGGVSIAAMAGFLRYFVAALRAHDQILSGRPVGQSGHPTHRDEVVAGFRIVGVEPTGSSAILLRPDSELESDELRLDVDADRLSTMNLDALMRAIADDQPLADPIVTALDSALVALGDGASVDVSHASDRQPLASINRARLDALRVEPTPHRTFTRITGRLVQFAIQPLQIGVQTADQTLWRCDYPPELEDVLYELTRQLVTVAGSGELVGRRAGRFKMVSIEPASVAAPEQLPVWTDDLPARVLVSSPSALELAAMQGIRPISTAADVRLDIWEDDEGVDEFVDWVKKRREHEQPG